MNKVHYKDKSIRKTKTKVFLYPIRKYRYKYYYNTQKTATIILHTTHHNFTEVKHPTTPLTLQSILLRLLPSEHFIISSRIYVNN